MEVELAKYCPYDTKEPAEIPDVADKVLREYFRIVGVLKIPSCLAYGTCLGFIRDGGYIPGDNDLDVAVPTPSNKLPPELRGALLVCGFKQGLTFPPPNNNVHFHRDRILLDIFFRKSEGFYTRLDKVMYKNEVYHIPCPVEGYLSACYTNWKVKSGQDGKHGV